MDARRCVSRARADGSRARGGGKVCERIGVPGEREEIEEIGGENARDAREDEENVEVEYVPAPLELELEGRGEEAVEAFREVFEAFARGSAAGTSGRRRRRERDGDEGDAEDDGKDGVGGEDEGEGEGEDGMSNKRRKELRRMKVAELKQSAQTRGGGGVGFERARSAVVGVDQGTSKHGAGAETLESKACVFTGKRGIEKPVGTSGFHCATGIQD